MRKALGGVAPSGIGALCPSYLQGCHASVRCVAPARVREDGPARIGSMVTRLSAWFALACACATVSPVPLGAGAAPPAGIASRAQAAARTIPIQDGSIVVTREDGADHVVRTSSDGEVHGESWCVVEDGSYDEFAGLFGRLVTAVQKHDVDAVSSMMQYPLTVNARRARTIRTPTQFKAGYATVFTPAVVKALSETQVADVFCKNGTAMIAGGIVWAAKEKGRVGVFVVNH